MLSERETSTMTRKFLLSLLSFTVVIGIVIAVTYHRIFVMKDYLVEYSIECDPFVETCYEEPCVDNECEPYYFKIVRKNAQNLYGSCGADIQNCPGSLGCFPSDTFCEIQSCDSEVEACVQFQHMPESVSDEAVGADNENTLE